MTSKYIEIDDLSEKAEKRVNKSLKIYNKFTYFESDWKFKNKTSGEITISNRDKLTGVTVNAYGSLEYNKSGDIVRESVLGTYDNGTPDLFYSLDFLGSNGFNQHRKAAYKRGDELTAIIETYGYDNQLVANWLDSLPGANPSDPFSTAVDFGQTNEFAFA